MRNALNKKVDIMEGVSMLVSKGYPLEWLLNECTVDTFQQLILITTKQTIEQHRMFGYTIMSAIGSLMSKKSGNKVEQTISKQISDLDDKIRDFNDDDYEGGDYEVRRVGRRKGKKDIMRQLSSFHKDFARLVGGRLPSLDDAIRRANGEQQKAKLMNQE